MFYRRAGIRHTSYRSERRLWRLPFDRGLVTLVCALLVIAPLVVDRLYLVGYLMPWVIWSTAALGLNFLMGGAGQVHLGYGAIIAIGAYTSTHLVRAHAPFEIAILAGGLASAMIGSAFGAALLILAGVGTSRRGAPRRREDPPCPSLDSARGRASSVFCSPSRRPSRRSRPSSATRSIRFRR